MTAPAEVPAVRIHQDGKGQWTARRVVLQYNHPIGRTIACDLVRRGRTVFVREEDADAVLAAAREGAGDGKAVS